jgi:hypothetical protein
LVLSIELGKKIRLVSKRPKGGSFAFSIFFGRASPDRAGARPYHGWKPCYFAAAATELDNEWNAMIFFLSPAESLDGLRPLDLLRDSRVREAAAYAERYDRDGA